MASASKKIITFILSVIMTISIVPITAYAGNDEVIISNKEELIQFRDNVNSGTTYEGVTVLLSSYIDLECSAENQWTPIGTKENPFMGSFNLDVDAIYTIANIYIDGNLEYAGFFGYVKNASIELFNLSGNITNHLENGYTGGIVAFADNSSIKEVTNKVTVTGVDNVGGVVGYSNNMVYYSHNDAAVNGRNNVGGIVGTTVGTSASRNTNSGGITGKDNVGGIIGYSSATNTTINRNTNSVSVTGDNFVGGIVGLSNSSIVRCENYADLGCNVATFGGIVGKLNGSDEDVSGVKLYQCTNSGTLYGGSTSNEDSGYIIGGLVGENSYGTVLVSNNTGDVGSLSLGFRVGGLVGLNKGTVESCYNDGKVISHVFACGDIVGSNIGDVKNCYYLSSSPKGGISSNDVEGSAEEKSEEQFRSGEIAYLLQKDFTSPEWCQYLGVYDRPIYRVNSIAIVYKISFDTSATNDADYSVAAIYGNSGETKALPAAKDKYVWQINGVNSTEATFDSSDIVAKAVDICTANGKAHTPMATVINARETSCSKEGYTGDIACSVCGTIIEKGKAIPKTPHTYGADGFCTKCGELRKDSNGNFIISNEEQLYWFAKYVNNKENGVKIGYDYENTYACYANAVLTNDITVNSNLLNSLQYNDDGQVTNSADFKSWNVIGCYSSKEDADFDFAGHFYGNGHTISGLYCNDSSASYLGLFGSAGEGAVIENVNVRDSYFCGRESIGSIAGGLFESTINNCSFDGIVTSDNPASPNNSCFGGIVGFGFGSVSNCVNYGKIYSYDMTGGIAGYNCSEEENFGVISNCKNYGSVSSKKNRAGGIAGINRFSDTTSLIKDCTNYGDVSSYSDCGGICGDNYDKVESCSNLGAVSGDTSIGGIVGYNNDDAEIKNSLNAGFITASYGIGYICGINESIISNCYYLENMSKNPSFESKTTGIGSEVGNNYVEDIKGSTEVKTARELASGEVAILLGDDFGQTIGKDEHPVVGGKKVYTYKTGACNNPVVNYSNTKKSDNLTHTYDENGKCVYCGATKEPTKKPAPTIVSGANQTISKNQSATFKSDAALEDFVKVLVDGKEVPSSEYTLKKGSTIVTLKASYINSLSEGKHTLSIVSKNGSADTEFTVTNPLKTDESKTSPKTGNESNISLWAIMMFVSSGALVLLVVKKRKNVVK